jgi:amino acid transporter
MITREETPPPALPAGERLDTVKRALIGRPRSGAEMDETLLSKTLALPVFASDPLSSVAYATESGLVVLVTASAAAASKILPISFVISALLAIVIVSYRQTVRAYQTSGGAYVVARDNLGRTASLVGAAALLVDYVLTVAVSVAAGILAITSLAPSVASHKVGLSLAAVALLTIVNLRGVRESGIAFALPTYSFVAVMFAMVVVGTVKCAAGSCPHATVPDPVATGTGAITLFLLVRAFASGAVALTGVEAISNGVGAFRAPKGRNAASTLGILGVISITLFIGVSYLTVEMHALPSNSVSLVSEIARATFPAGSPGASLYYAVQVLTFAILVLAANTSYQGFPRLAAVLARDRCFPRQFVNLGDRLVYSNGIIVLAALASLLIWIFHANVISLIHLYVVGVFTAFTLSQAGMVRYWRRRRDRGWQRRAAINGVGAATTGVVTLLVIQAKFAAGAWMVTIAVPALIGVFLLINRHYRKVARRLRAGAAAVAAAPTPTNQVVLYVDSYNAALQEAVWYARTIAGDDFRAIHLAGPHSDTGLRPRFRQLTDIHPDLELVQPEDGRVDAVIDYLWALPRGESHFVTAIIPEQFRRASILEAVARRTEFSLKVRLLKQPGLVITDVPVLAGRPTEWRPPARTVCRILVSGSHAASMRAVNYAGTLGLADTKALFFAFDTEEVERIRTEWQLRPMGVPLEVEEAPFRDLGDPLLRHLRRVTADPDTVVVVVMPELVFSGPQRLLHNQRALYIKRLLLFEPRVILTSVPYRLS